MKLGKYLIFAWEEYEAAGGFNDFVDSCNRKKKAIEILSEESKIGYRFGHVINKDSGIIIITLSEGNIRECKESVMV